MTETTATAAEIPDQIGFGFAELLVLLSLNPGGASERSAHGLGLGEHLGNQLVFSAGASSLIARGFATLTEADELEVEGPVAAVADALSRGEYFVSVSLMTADSLDQITFVGTDDLAVLLQARGGLTWWAMAQRPEVSTAGAVLFIARSHLAQHAGGGVSLTPNGDAKAPKLLIKNTDGQWIMGTYTFGEETVEEIPVGEADLVKAIQGVFEA